MNEIEVVYRCPYCGAQVEHSFAPPPIPATDETVYIFNCQACNGLLVTKAENLQDSETVWEIPVSKAHYESRHLVIEDPSFLSTKQTRRRPPAISNEEIETFRSQLDREGVIPNRWLFTPNADVPPISAAEIEQIKWNIRHSL